jgi:hypothetical protein
MASLNSDYRSLWMILDHPTQRTFLRIALPVDFQCA